MANLFFKEKPKWTDPRTRPGYVNPFEKKELTEQEKKLKELQKWETVAAILKKNNNYTTPVKDMAATLYDEAEKLKERKKRKPK